MLGYRSNDAVITICQNNQAKSIEIIGMNEQASALLGYSAAELKGRSLATMIPMRLSTLLLEYVEYDPDANDVGMVLSRVQNFSMHTKDQKEKFFRMKVVRGESTREKLTFQLILQDAVNVRKDDAIRKMIQEHFKGHEQLDKETGVPNRQSLEKDIDLVATYHHKEGLRASFVVIQPDHLISLEKQYEGRRADILKHIIHICRRNVRPDDVIGVIDDRRIGILLLDSMSDSTRMVANRLRWQVASQPFPLNSTNPLSLSASMIFVNIDGTKTGSALIASCEKALSDAGDDQANWLKSANN